MPLKLIFRHEQIAQKIQKKNKKNEKISGTPKLTDDEIIYITNYKIPSRYIKITTKRKNYAIIY